MKTIKFLKGKNNVEELDINFISSAIGELYNISGKGSLDKKGLQIMNILNKCKTADEVKFVFRILKVICNKNLFANLFILFYF